MSTSAPQLSSDEKITSSRDAAVRVSEDGSTLSIRFFGNEDPSVKFHAPWLWENDPSYIHPSSGQRTRSSLTVFYEGFWRIRAASLVREQDLSTKSIASPIVLPIPPPPKGCLHPVGSVYAVPTSEHTRDCIDDCRLLLRIDWQGKEDTTTSYYDRDWLYRCRYDDGTLSHRHVASAVRKPQALRSDDQLYEQTFHDLINDEDALYTFLLTVVEVGAALVTQAPGGDQKAVALVAKRLAGILSHGHLYGDLFQVKSTPKAENIAYTSVALAPHQDLSYYESPPGLQLLHCVKNSVVGGESKLVDALAAANEFRNLCPDLFHILCNTEATFLKQRQGADMMYRRSHIRVDSLDQVVSVHWSPPFEGPLCIASNKVEDFYVARTAFELMLDSSFSRDARLLPMLDISVEEALRDYARSYSWERRLEPGEVLVFSNQRMLHGRHSFQFSSNGERHLVGCYTNIDETMNNYRLLRRTRLDETCMFIRNTGNGSSSVM